MHVAAGETTRQIASALAISEHTVRRHLQNVFAKLDLPSRAAATAWAHRHDLLPWDCSGTNRLRPPNRGGTSTR